VCKGTPVEIGRMWTQLLGEIWTNHLVGLDEFENTIQRVYLDFPHNWKEHKEDGKDYTFEALCGLLITD
jgi:hypothetical protein